MPNGFVRGLLLTQQQVYNGQAPSQKITPPGYLKMLLNNTTPNIVSSTIDNGSGHIRDVSIKYRPRTVPGQSGTEDDCSIQATPAYKEATIPALSFRKMGRFFDFDTIRQYEEEASKTVFIGRPAPPMGILMEMWNLILETANGLFGDIDIDLLTAQAAAFGKNQTTGLATAKTINFPLSTATNPLNSGLTMLMSDVMSNEIKPTAFTNVGDGFINSAYIQQSLNTSNTKDANWPGSMPPFFWDPYATGAWGANQFGAFERNAVQLVNINKFNGFVSGNLMTSWLFTLTLPILTDSLGGSLAGFKFDVQLRSVDCPQELIIGGAAPAMVGRGWILDLMANYAQFNLPTDAYDATDRLTGNNGSLRYVATNA